MGTKKEVTGQSLVLPPATIFSTYSICTVLMCVKPQSCMHALSLSLSVTQYTPCILVSVFFLVACVRFISHAEISVHSCKTHMVDCTPYPVSHIYEGWYIVCNIRSVNLWSDNKKKI